MTCGIYCITNNINGMKYVGQSIDIENRFQQHIKSESKSKIHEALVEHGVHNFRFEILVECLPEELDEQEVKFIRVTDSYNNGYNQTPGAQHRVFNVEWEYDMYSELEKSNKFLKSKLKKKDELIAQLTKERSSLNLENNNLTSENDKLIGKIFYLEKTLEQKKESENRTIKQLRQKILKLENGEYSSLKKKLKSLEEQNRELEFEIKQMETKQHTTVNESNIFYRLLNDDIGKESAV